MVKDTVIVNVGEIDEAIEQLVSEGIAEQKGGAYYINLENIGIDKVLGSGKVTNPLFITASEFSPSAKAKIDEAKGKTIELAEKTKTPETE